MSEFKALLAPLLNWRDRLLVNADFQRWSLRLPIARWVARRRMRKLFDLCSGFVYSQVLLACTRMKLFELLSQSPRRAVDLADHYQMPLRSIERLLLAAESLDLLESRGRQLYGLGPLGAALLGNPSVGMMIEHHEALYADLTDPVALLRDEVGTTELGKFWAYSRNAGKRGRQAEDTNEYSQLMAASQSLIADQVFSAYPFKNHRQLLDVGGGFGAFAIAALVRHRQLKAQVFDLPSVADGARKRFEFEGVTERAGAQGGDFINDRLPAGSDLVTLVRILHDHDDEVVLGLLKSVRNAISEDGTLLIAEPMIGARGAQPVAAAYFGFYLMAMGQGRARSALEIKAMLHKAGFVKVRSHRTAAPLLVSVLTAKPGKPLDC